MQSSQPASNSYNLFIVQNIFTKQPLFCTPDGFATILAVSFGTCRTQPQEWSSKSWVGWRVETVQAMGTLPATFLQTSACIRFVQHGHTWQVFHQASITLHVSHPVAKPNRCINTTVVFREVLCLLISWSKDLQRCSLMVRALAKPAKPCLIPLQQLVQPACRHTHFLTNLSARKCSPHCGWHKKWQTGGERYVVLIHSAVWWWTEKCKKN